MASSDALLNWYKYVVGETNLPLINNTNYKEKKTTWIYTLQSSVIIIINYTTLFYSQNDKFVIHYSRTNVCIGGYYEDWRRSIYDRKQQNNPQS